MMYDTKEIENLLQHIKHLPHVDAGEHIILNKSNGYTFSTVLYYYTTEAALHK